MPYTFGGGTGDDIVFTANNSIGASSRTALVTGWWRPTTLTTGRGLWSAGSVCGAEINATTDELLLRTDNTTDGTWTTTGVDLVVNEWRFIAFFLTCTNTGPAAAWRIWAGNVETAPVAVTVTAGTAPVGNFTGSAAYYAGNKGTGTVAFQGDIADMAWLTTAGGAGATANPFSIAALGACTADEEENIYRRYVLPIWEGKIFEGLANYSQWNTQIDLNYSALLDSSPIIRTPGNGAISSFVAPTINGATISLNGSPRPRRGLVWAPPLRRR